MKVRIAFLISILAVGFAACDRPATPEENRAKQERELKTDDAARKAGRAAYEASEETEKAAKELGRKLDKAAAEAHKGWDDAKRDHKDQSKP